MDSLYLEIEERCRNQEIDIHPSDDPRLVVVKLLSLLESRPRGS